MWKCAVKKGKGKKYQFQRKAHEQDKPEFLSVQEFSSPDQTGKSNEDNDEINRVIIKCLSEDLRQQIIPTYSG